MMLNRARAPRVSPIRYIDQPTIEKVLLDNGAPLFIVHSGSQEVVRVEVVFNAGRPYETKPLVARAAASQIREGTARYSSAEIAEHFDFYGSEFSNPFHLDTANLSIVALNKYLGEVLPVFSEVLQAPAYPEAELENFIERNRQKLLVDLSQNDVVAYRQITEMIFGPHHPYGYNSTPEMYAALRTQDLHAHFSRAFNAANCQVFASGMVDEAAIRQINASLGQAIQAGEAVPASIPPSAYSPRQEYLKKANSHQTAIRIGRKLFTRSHPDYQGMFVVNTLLGGYFGSRLMSNVREKKGYTYNIYSAIETMRFDGYFYVSTETGNDVAADAVKQIFTEIEVLQNKLVGKKELELARNYLMGTLLSQMDGPFNTMDLVRSLAGDGLTLSFFQDAIRVVQEITPEEIRELAQRYLGRDEMWEVLVGP